MMEGLGWSLKHVKEVGDIKGLQLSETGQALTHEEFVDDTMLQGIPTVKEALEYKHILFEFAMAIDMEVNLSKSKIIFFNTNIAIQRNISIILGFQRDVLPSKYLGVPLTDKPLHKSIWEPVINKMQDKIRKWTIRSLNLAGGCQLCEAQEETMEHLLNNCIFTSWLWDTFATIFQQTNKDRGSIVNTLNNWRHNFSDYEFLGSAWALTPSFIIWTVWKERNNRIFKNEKSSSQCLFEQILRQLEGTVSNIVQTAPKNPPSKVKT
eukprot:PITA_03775